MGTSAGPCHCRSTRHERSVKMKNHASTEQARPVAASLVLYQLGQDQVQALTVAKKLAASSCGRPEPALRSLPLGAINCSRICHPPSTSKLIKLSHLPGVSLSRSTSKYFPSFHRETPCFWDRTQRIKVQLQPYLAA